MKGITHPEDAYIFGQVNKMYITTEGISGLANNFNERPVKLPDAIVKLGTINFTGEISGFFDNLVAFGKFSSAIGSVQTDLIFGNDKEKNIAAYLKGHLSTSPLHLNELFPDGNPYGTAKLAVTLDTHRPANGSFSGNIKANIDEFEYKGYKYENILLSGNFQKTGSTECWTSTIRTANCMPKGYSCMKAKILCSTSLHVWNISIRTASI